MIRHKLYIDDAKHALTLIPDSSVDLVITGPPYWNEVVYSNQPGQLSAISDYPTFLEKMAKIWQQCSRVLKPGGILAFWVHDLYRSKKEELIYIPLHADLIEILPSILILRQISIWDRYLSRIRNYVPFREGTKYQYIVISQKEGHHDSNQNLISKSLREEFWKPIWSLKTTPRLLGSRLIFRMAFKFGAPFSDKLISLKRKIQVLLKDGYRFTEYKTACPSEIAQRLMEKYSQINDTVLDPFLGSGTSMRVADQLKRRCLGIEINPEATSIILKKAGKDKVEIIK